MLQADRGRYAILSDQHKGAGDEADEFCAPAYAQALDYYREQGFTLILLGDAEELWENPWPEVEATYRDSALAAEKSVGPDRYLRIRGNHDDRWIEPDLVARELRHYMPVDQVWEAIRFQVMRGDEWLGELFVVHGHQGEFGSDTLAPVARVALRCYRWIQNLTGIGKQTPATSVELLGWHDRVMYEWATTHSKLALIAGHTHRPVWTSRTHLQKLEEELRLLQAVPAPQRGPGFASDLAAKEAEVADRRAKAPPAPDDAVRPIGCYFNTGCCKFSDGDITGMELDGGELRLIKWSNPPPGERIVLEKGSLAGILARLP